MQNMTIRCRRFQLLISITLENCLKQHFVMDFPNSQVEAEEYQRQELLDPLSAVSFIASHQLPSGTPDGDIHTFSKWHVEIITSIYLLLVFKKAYRYIYEASNDLKPGRRKTTCKDTMDNYNVLCSFIIFLQITFLPWGSTYNFSLCNHGKIQEDLLNVLDADMTFTQEELRLDFHTCEDAPPEPTGKYQSEDSRQAERAGRLLECLLERARGCGERPELWRVTRFVLKHHCPGFCTPQWGTGTAQRDSPGDRAGSADGMSSPVPCDKSKARELMAVWRSYNNLG